MPIGLYRLGGSSFCCKRCDNKNCLLPMKFTGNTTNDWYYKPGNRASWARRSRPGGGQNRGRQNANRIGVNRLGGNRSNSN